MDNAGAGCGVDGACYADDIVEFFFRFGTVVAVRTDCAMCVCDGEAWTEITIKMRIVYKQMTLDKYKMCWVGEEES